MVKKVRADLPRLSAWPAEGGMGKILCLLQLLRHFICTTLFYPAPLSGVGWDSEGGSVRRWKAFGSEPARARTGTVPGLLPWGFS